MSPDRLIPIVLSAARLAAPLASLSPELRRILPGAVEMLRDFRALEAQVRALLDDTASARLDAELRGLRADVQQAGADLESALQGV